MAAIVWLIYLFRLILGGALWLKEQYGKVPKRKLYLIGMGPGAQSQLTKEAAECLKSRDVILGAKRLLALCREVSYQPAHSCYRRDEV